MDARKKNPKPIMSYILFSQNAVNLRIHMSRFVLISVPYFLPALAIEGLIFYSQNLLRITLKAITNFHISD